MAKDLGTTVRGVRLENDLWIELEKLAKADIRNLNNYISFVLKTHVKEKKIDKK